MLGTRIVVATDLSAAAAPAARWAAAAGGLLGLPVVVAHVVELGFANWWRGAYETLDDTEKRAAVAAHVAGWYGEATGAPPADADIRVDDCVSGLTAAAQERDAALLVMAPTGHGAAHRVLVGSRVHQVASRPPCPLVIAHDDAGAPRRGMRIVAGTDFSPVADQAVALAAELAARLGGSLDLVFVAHLPRSVAVVSRLLGSDVAPDDVRRRGEMSLKAVRQDVVDRVAPGLECRPHVLTGRVPDTLESFSRDPDIGLLVLGQTGIGTRVPEVLGGTAHALVQRLPTSVAIVPPRLPAAQ